MKSEQSLHILFRSLRPCKHVIFRYSTSSSHMFKNNKPVTTEYIEAYCKECPPNTWVGMDSPSQAHRWSYDTRTRRLW